MSEISDLMKRGKSCGVRQGLALLIVYPFGKTDTSQPISKSCTMNAWSPSVTLIPLSWRHGRLTVSSSNVPTFVQTMSPRPFPYVSHVAGQVGVDDVDASCSPHKPHEAPFWSPPTIALLMPIYCSMSLALAVTLCTLPNTMGVASPGTAILANNPMRPPKRRSYPSALTPFACRSK